MPPAAFRRQPDAVAAAAGWFGRDAGLALLASEVDVLQQAIQSRIGQACLWLAPLPAGTDADPGILKLHAAECGLAGDVRTALPLPLASESCGVVVVQHLADLACDPGLLLEECARVLVPGGRLWLLALNPLSPYRMRWRGQGPRVAEPVTWRRRLRSVGLQPEPVSQGLGPTWTVALDPAMQDGAGLRAAFLLRAEKRRVPMIPRRAPARLGWQAEPNA
ncbi:methyltransferase domain-containing protein [Thermomonas mangrovi]|uniref:methyltransferase domain-containing protein n=1 Tax=Thermomonas mangrovi TaxID=2993316 RepID=UPI00230718CA|nr:methyltransferase domain-containing protein [Thermomonas mangrovi]